MRVSGISFPVLLFTGVVVFFLSCIPAEKMQDTVRVKTVVERYTQLLTEAAKTGDTEPLRVIASEPVTKRLYYWVAAWQDADIYMNAGLREITYTGVEVKGTEARVRTAEEWVYEYRNMKTGQVVFPVSGLYYEMEYTLQKSDGKWSISSISVKREVKRGEGEKR